MCRNEKVGERERERVCEDCKRRTARRRKERNTDCKDTQRQERKEEMRIAYHHHLMSKCILFTARLIPHCFHIYVYMHTYI